jgi:hypothetical protein
MVCEWVICEENKARQFRLGFRVYRGNGYGYRVIREIVETTKKRRQAILNQKHKRAYNQLPGFIRIFFKTLPPFFKNPSTLRLLNLNLT